MVEFFVFIVFLLLAMLGLSEAICVLINWLLRPQRKALKLLVVYLNEGFAEQQLLQVAESLNWRGGIVGDKIVAYTGDIGYEEKEAIIKRFGNNKNIVFTDFVNIQGI